MQNAECGGRSVELRAAGRLVLGPEMDSDRAALGIVEEFKTHVGSLKVGHQLFQA